MRGKDMVALGRIVLAKRERVIALQPWDKGLLGTTLRYAYEVRNAGEYFDEIPDTKIPKDMLQLAEHILESKAGDFDPSTFVDHYEEAVVEMLKHKQAGAPVVEAEGRGAGVERRQPDGCARNAASRPRKALPRPAAAKKGKGKPDDLRKSAAVQVPDRGRQGEAAEDRGGAEVDRRAGCEGKAKRKSA